MSAPVDAPECRELLAYIYLFGMDNSTGRLAELLNRAAQEVGFPEGGRVSVVGAP